MIIINKYRDQKVGVLGLGKTGIASIYSLIIGRTKVTVWEDNEQIVQKIQDEINNPQSIEHALLAQAIIAGDLVINPDIEHIKYQKAIIISPGIPLLYPKPHRIIVQANKYKIPLISDIELLQEACAETSYIGITGTNGKSTTTALIGHIFQKAGKLVQVGGNIGNAALSLETLDHNGTYVLEMSSFQLELINQVRFNISVFLNLTPDHLDRYQDMQDYKNAKLNILKNQRAGDQTIICIDSYEMQHIHHDLKENGKQSLIAISTQQVLKEGISLVDNVIYEHINNEKVHYDLGERRQLPGQHNAENIVASYAACRAAGIKAGKIIDAIRSFKGLKHRTELVLEVGGLKFINDSKATNADAAEKALRTFDDIYWIAGGICKDDGIEPLSYLFHKLKHVYLIGSASQKFAEVLEKYQVQFTHADNLEKALHLIKAQNYHNGCVLLSPACSSYDQWKNFEERGNKFYQLVHELWSC